MAQDIVSRSIGCSINKHVYKQVWNVIEQVCIAQHYNHEIVESLVALPSPWSRHHDHDDVRPPTPLTSESVPGFSYQHNDDQFQPSTHSRHTRRSHIEH